MGVPVHITKASLLELASSLRSDGTAAQFTLGTDEKPICDGQCQIYVVNFTDDDTTTWAIRVYAPMAGSLARSSVTSIVDNEMTVLKKLETSGFRWSPRLVGGDQSFNNSLGYPYLILKWFPGTALKWSASNAVDPQQRQKVLRQLLDIQLELAEATRESRPATSTRGYLTDVINSKIERVAQGSLPAELDVRSCLVQRALVPYVVHEGLEESFFAIAHGNLASHKIIVDGEYNITGIVDWKLARYRPMQLALRFPRLLAIDPMSEEEKQPHPSRVAWVRPDSSLSADRDYVLTELAAMAGRNSTKTPLASAMKTIWSDPGVDWQDLLIEACFSKGLHEWLAEKSWLSDMYQTSAGQQVMLPSEQVIEDELKRLTTSAKS